jgi:DNA-binding LytR/AlgR family response regulator
MKDKLTCYIVDDEPLARQILTEYIAKVPFLELTGTYGSALDASGPLKANKPDLLFLDINMPDLDGLSFIPMLNPKPLIVLTTAYDQHALKAYELEVTDYLLKPISFERFYKSALRLFQNSNDQLSPKLEPTTGIANDEEYLFIKVGHRIQKVAIKEIIYVEGMKDYLRIHTLHDKFMTLMSFSRLEVYLPDHKFARVHKSFVVALDKIDHIEKNRISIADQTIPISETYAERFYKMLRGLG